MWFTRLLNVFRQHRVSRDIEREMILRRVCYWSRRAFPLTSGAWMALVLVERKTGVEFPQAFELILIGASFASFPGGIIEVRRYGDRTALLAWFGLMTGVLIVGTLRAFFAD